MSKTAAPLLRPMTNAFLFACRAVLTGPACASTHVHAPSQCQSKIQPSPDEVAGDTGPKPRSDGAWDMVDYASCGMMIGDCFSALQWVKGRLSDAKTDGFGGTLKFEKGRQYNAGFTRSEKGGANELVGGVIRAAPAQQ